MNASSIAPDPVLAVAKRILSVRASEVAPYARLYPLLLADMGEIMAEWDRKTDELPWSELEQADRQNNLAERDQGMPFQERRETWCEKRR